MKTKSKAKRKMENLSIRNLRITHLGYFGSVIVRRSREPKNMRISYHNLPILLAPRTLGWTRPATLLVPRGPDCRRPVHQVLQNVESMICSCSSAPRRRKQTNLRYSVGHRPPALMALNCQRNQTCVHLLLYQQDAKRHHFLPRPSRENAQEP